MNIVEAILDRLLPKKVIVNCEKQPYLHRWYVVRTERVSLFVHKFVRSDEDRALHDHPWSFIVLPIWRGYIEHNERLPNIPFDSEHIKELADYVENGPDFVPHQSRVWPILGTRFRSSLYRHRVELIDGKPSWSLFIRFKKVREWGFWLPQGFMLWNKFWQDKCE